MTALVVITPPVDLPVSLDQAKKHLRVDFADDDDLITRMIKTATNDIDGPDGWLGRAVMQQTLEYRVDCFPQWHWDAWDLALPPVKEVVSLKYFDADGVDQTVDPGVYALIGSLGNRLVLQPGQNWPASIQSARCEGVRIRYTAGYADSASVPPKIVSALLLLIGHYYENRSEVVMNTQPIVLPNGVEALLAPLRIY